MLIRQTSDVDQAMARKLYTSGNDYGPRPSGVKAADFDVEYRFD